MFYLLSILRCLIKLTKLIEQTFNREGSLYLAGNDNNAFLSSGHIRKCVMLSVIFDNIFIRFGSKLYRQIVGFPMGTNCALLLQTCVFVLL